MYSVCIREPAPGYAPGFAPVFGGRPEQDYIADIRTNQRKLQFIMYCTSWSFVFPGGRHTPGAIRGSVKMNIEVKFMKYLHSG